MAGAPPAASRVFTIPPSAPFLPTLIRALGDGRVVDGFTPGPLDFADVTIFLPTRRACGWPATRFCRFWASTRRCCPVSCRSAISMRMSSSSPTWRRAMSPPTPRSAARARRIGATLSADAVGAQMGRADRAPAGETPLVMRHPAAALALADDLAQLMDDMTTRRCHGSASTDWCLTSSIHTGS